MTLTDPRDALAEQSTFIGYLMGLASLGRVVQSLASDCDNTTETSADADDFVHLLLGVASLGASVERLAESAPTQCHRETTTTVSDSAVTRWLR